MPALKYNKILCQFLSRLYSILVVVVTVMMMMIVITPWCWILPEKLIVTQLIKKLPVFLWNLKYITVFARACHCIMNPDNPVHTVKLNFFKTHIYIILSCTSTSFKRSLPFRFSNTNSDCTSLQNNNSSFHWGKSTQIMMITSLHLPPRLKMCMFKSRPPICHHGVIVNTETI
jgi:hypothetical protein